MAGNLTAAEQSPLHQRLVRAPKPGRSRVLLPKQIDVPACISLRRPQPVFDGEPCNAGEFGRIVRDQDGVDGQRMGSDQHVVRPDQLTLPLEIGSEPPVALIRVRLQRQYGQAREQLLDTLRER